MHPFSSNSRPAPQSSQHSARRRVSSKDPTSCIPRSMLSEFPSAATYLPIVTVPPFLLSLRVLGLRIITVPSHLQATVLRLLSFLSALSRLITNVLCHWTDLIALCVKAQTYSLFYFCSLRLAFSHRFSRIRV